MLRNRAVRTERGHVLDLDGTLVDSVYTHVVAWQQAFHDVGLHVPGWRLHELIGMGGDRLVTAATSEDVENDVGDEVRARHQERFEALFPSLRPTAGADALVRELACLDAPVTLATSGGPELAARLVDPVDGLRSILRTSAAGSADADSKPSGDLIEAALTRVEADRVVVIGDAVWDAYAAHDAGAMFVGLLTGGNSRQVLLEAGAVAVHESPEKLSWHLAAGHDITQPPAASDEEPV